MWSVRLSGLIGICKARAAQIGEGSDPLADPGLRLLFSLRARIVRAVGGNFADDHQGQGLIAGIFEHPTRHAPDKSVAQLHAEVALGALADAGSHATTSTAFSAPAMRRDRARRRWPSI